MERAIRYISILLRFIGLKGSLWILVGIISTFWLAILDYGIASLLQGLLVKLGAVTTDKTTLGVEFFSKMGVIALLVSFTLIGLLRSVGMYFLLHAGCLAKETLNYKLRYITCARMLRGDVSAYIPSSQLNLYLGEYFPKASTFVYRATLFASSAIQVGVLFAILAYINLLQAVLGFIGIGVVALIVNALNISVRRHSSKVPQAQNELLKTVQRICQNWLFINITKLQRIELNRISRSIQDYSSHWLLSAKLGNIGSAIPIALGTMVITGVIAADYQITGTIDAMIASFIYLFLRIVQQLNQCANRFASVNQNWPHFKEVIQLIRSYERDVPQLTKIEVPALESPTTAPKSYGSVQHLNHNFPAPTIRLDAVAFRYPGESQYAVSDISIQVQAGEMFGIQGPSGSGKSTLLSLMVGLYRPVEGKALVDDVEAYDFFRSHPDYPISYVGADPYIIEGSIRDNIMYGLENHISDKDLLELLNDVRLGTLAGHHANLLDKELTEDGQGLSAGQKQRLALARALARKPKLLILDEASANLDVETEEKIAETIATFKNRCTTIIVSHRPGILAPCDEIFSFETGSAR